MCVEYPGCDLFLNTNLMMDTTKLQNKLPVDISDYKELVTKDYIFSDKSLFIRDFMYDCCHVTQLTRPKGFGKTLNLSMLSYFLDINMKEDLFANSLISKDKEFCEKYQGKYPVIFLSFKDIKASSFEESFEQLKVTVSKLYEKHIYLYEDDCLDEFSKKDFEKILNKTADRSDVLHAIKDLSDYLYTKFSKSCIILIDEYDTPLQQAYISGYYDKMMNCIYGIFNMALKDNTHLSKAIITGITNIGQGGMFAGFNNHVPYTNLKSRYAEYFGFSKEEVKDLISKANSSARVEEIQKWYNGYTNGNKHSVYNPSSVISCLNNGGEMKAYWLNKAQDEFIKQLLEDAFENVKKKFLELSKGQSVEIDFAMNLVFPQIQHCSAYLWTLLIYSGYLNVESMESEGFRSCATVSLPNKEVAYVCNLMDLKL